MHILHTNSGRELPEKPSGKVDWPPNVITIVTNDQWRNVFTQLNVRVHCSTASVSKDMLRIKSRQAEILGFSSSDLDFILDCLCVS